MDDLVAVLRKEIAEDERCARWTAEHMPGAYATGPNGARFGPDRVLREVEVRRRLPEDLLAEPHVRVDDDWFSCSQARDEGREWACVDESRAGSPCGCGRDERVRRRLLLLVEAYGQT